MDIQFALDLEINIKTLSYPFSSKYYASYVEVHDRNARQE